MEEIRKFLRYEIPGLITVIYFLLLSYPLLRAIADHWEIHFTRVIDILSELAIVLVVFAFFTGVLLYKLYIYFEEESFSEKREGINVISEILREDPSFAEELTWWETQERVRKNETLDIIFYKEKESSRLEKGFTLHHTHRIIGKWAPFAAAIATVIFGAILIEYSSISFNEIDLAFLNSFFVFIYFFCIGKSITFSKRFWKWLGYPLLFLVIVIVLISESVLILSLAIIVVSWIIIRLTFEDSFQKKKINELERMLLILRKEEIKKLIRQVYHFNRSNSPSKSPTFEVFKDKSGEFRFRLKAPNGEIIATGEGYTRKNSCLKGIESVKRNAPIAKVVETEK